MKQDLPAHPQSYSLLTSMYLSWEEYKIPAVYYHYLLAILPKLDKNRQVLVMTREVKSLKANSHPYHKIVNAIEAREKSLEIIRANLHIFVQYQSTEQMEWPNSIPKDSHIELEFDEYTPKKNSKFQSVKYGVVHEDPLSPILTPPRLDGKPKQSQIQELLNHIRVYQSVTVQIVSMIAAWEGELKELGYMDSVIQFQFRKEDYLQVVNKDVTDILTEYQLVFENNPFLLMKKAHEKSQLVLMYQELKLKEEMVNKVYYCLNVIANHEAEILRFRMLAKVSQTGSKKRTISKSTDISKIYMNYNHGKHYILIKDPETMKKSKVLQEPPLSKNIHLNEDLSDSANSRIQGLKNSILINPETKIPTIDRTVLKHPVKSNILNLLSNSKAQHTQQSLKTPQQRGPQNQPTNNIDLSLKRSQTEDIFKFRSASMMLDEANTQNMPFKANLSSNQFRQRVQVKPVNGQNTILVGDINRNGRNDEIDRNKGLSTQQKLELVNNLNSTPKLKNISYVELYQKQKNSIVNEPAFGEVEVQVETKKVENIGQLSESNKINLVFEENIKSTQVVKYLRQKVFENSPQVTFEQIQSLGKRILSEKNFITFIRVECNNLKVAWLAVKFIEKDNTMRRSVFIVYVRKFVRLSGFERKLLDNFVGHGYGLIRNEQRILYQIEILDVVLRPVIKVKYKVSPTSEKEQIKRILKKEQTLGYSRILKYYSYSKTSKYHAFCQHEKSYCQISYNFLQVSKICVERNHYIQAKADKISKLGQNLYRVSCVVNETDLVVGNSLADILAMEKESQIEKDSSFDSKCQNKYQYIGIREGKVMRKFVNEGDEAVVCQFVTIMGNIPEVRSIALTRQELKDQVLLLDPPYYMAIMTRDFGELKTLSVLEFS